MTEVMQVREAYRVEQWRQLMQQRKDSPLNNREFCAQQGISEKSYYYWLKKLRESAMERGILQLVALEDREKLDELRIEYADLVECLPYDDAVYMLKVTGTQLERMIRHILRDEAFQGEHTEFYQFSHGMRIVWSRSGQVFRELTLDGEVLHADRLYSVAMQKYHYNNLKPFLNITLEEAEQNGKIRVLSTSARDVVEEYLTVNQHLSREVEGRLVVEA